MGASPADLWCTAWGHRQLASLWCTLQCLPLLSPLAPCGQGGNAGDPEPVKEIDPGAACVLQACASPAMAWGRGGHNMGAWGAQHGGRGGHSMGAWGAQHGGVGGTAWGRGGHNMGAWGAQPEHAACLVQGMLRGHQARGRLRHVEAACRVLAAAEAHQIRVKVGIGGLAGGRGQGGSM